MLQRSPSYILSLPGKDPLAIRLRRRFSARRTYSIVRWKNVLLSSLVFRLCRRAPDRMAGLIRRFASNQLPADFDIDTHLSPRYKPWDQRLCLVPDGDLFKAISAGKAEIVTDAVESFTEHGVALASGRELAADVIVTATGLNVLILGGMTLTVDGTDVDLGETVAYKGMMLCGVPNAALTLGYTNASWTLKADLVAQYVCRLLKTMDRRGHADLHRPAARPAAPARTDHRPQVRVRAARDRGDAQAGPTAPWRLHQNYIRDVYLLKRGSLDDAMVFSTPRARPADAPVADDDLVVAA